MLCETKSLNTFVAKKLQCRSIVWSLSSTRRYPQNNDFNYSLNYQQDDKRGFLERVEACVRESQETVYENEDGSSLRFTEPKPAHVCYSWRHHARLYYQQQLVGRVDSCENRNFFPPHFKQEAAK